MKCVIFDLDGTLADVRHRLHHIKDGRTDWASFFDACVDDPCHDYVRELNRMVARGTTVEEFRPMIFVCSGRPDSHRRESVAWLESHGIEYDVLMMRAAGDHRPDVVVKREMLEAIRGQGFEVMFAVDDRPSVVQMWRDNGVPCLAVDDRDWRETAGVSFAGDLEGQTLLTLMVGPSHAGKDAWLWSYLALGGPITGHTLTPDNLGINPEHVVSSDQIRVDLGIADHGRESNDRTFGALHAVVRTRLAAGLPTVVNATNIRRKNRLALVDMAPVGTRVRYVVLDRPLEDKLAHPRHDFPLDVVRRHHQQFRSALPDILVGDGRPEVEVLDLRIAS